MSKALNNGWDRLSHPTAMGKNDKRRLKYRNLNPEDYVEGVAKMIEKVEEVKEERDFATGDYVDTDY